jgi:hypothetical protein
MVPARCASPSTANRRDRGADKLGRDILGNAGKAHLDRAVAALEAGALPEGSD